jgi:putative DNA primase/helicase
MTPHELARALGGEVVRVRGADQVLAPGLDHSPRDRSLSIRFGPHGLALHSFAGGDLGAELARAQALIGTPLASSEHRPCREPVPNAAPPKPDRSALWIWGEAEHPWNTRVERYLNKRGLYLPACAAGAAIRSDIHHRFRSAVVPAMLALIRHIATDAPQAIHRTALSWADGNYAVSGDKRLCMGPTRGGAVKLTPHAAVRDKLGIAEGIETALSLLALDPAPTAVWALLNAEGIKHFPVLPVIARLVIAVDHDPAGINAADTCAARWTRAGRTVVLHKPKTPGRDLNDLTRGDA